MWMRQPMRRRSHVASDLLPGHGRPRQTGQRSGPPPATPLCTTPADIDEDFAYFSPGATYRSCVGLVSSLFPTTCKSNCSATNSRNNDGRSGMPTNHIISMHLWLTKRIAVPAPTLGYRIHSCYLCKGF